MGQSVRPVADYLSALLQEQIDAWRDELTKGTSAQAKGARDTEPNRETESDRKKSSSGAQQQSKKKGVSSEGPDLN
jgi:hypothetical protein